MKKEYGTPKVEKMDFDYKESVTASNGTGLTDNNGVVSAGGWVCQERIVDQKNVPGTVCGYV